MGVAVHLGRLGAPGPSVSSHYKTCSLFFSCMLFGCILFFKGLFYTHPGALNTIKVLYYILLQLCYTSSHKFSIRIHSCGFVVHLHMIPAASESLFQITAQRRLIVTPALLRSRQINLVSSAHTLCKPSSGSDSTPAARFRAPRLLRRRRAKTRPVRAEGGSITPRALANLS